MNCSKPGGVVITQHCSHVLFGTDMLQIMYRHAAATQLPPKCLCVGCIADIWLHMQPCPEIAYAYKSAVCAHTGQKTLRQYHTTVTQIQRTVELPSWDAALSPNSAGALSASSASSSSCMVGIGPALKHRLFNEAQLCTISHQQCNQSLVHVPYMHCTDTVTRL